MEKNITLQQSPSTRRALSITDKARRLWLSVSRRVCGYYSSVLERELSPRQTALIINAQAAFIVAVFPVEGPLLLRIAAMTWLICALLKCKAEI